MSGSKQFAGAIRNHRSRVRQEINQICRQLRQTNSPHDLIQSPQEFRIVQIIPQEALRGKQADERPQIRNRPTGELRDGRGNPSWVEFIEHLIILRQLRLVVGDQLGIEQNLDQNMAQKMGPKAIVGRQALAGHDKVARIALRMPAYRETRRRHGDAAPCRWQRSPARDRRRR